MIAWIAIGWMVVGAAFMAVAGLGVARMPDLFSRMQAAAKSGTVGAGAILVGISLYTYESAYASKAAVVIAFLILTAPVAAHMLARAGYLLGVPLVLATQHDDLREKFGKGETVEGGTPSPAPERPR